MLLQGRGDPFVDCLGGHGDNGALLARLARWQSDWAGCSVAGSPEPGNLEQRADTCPNLAACIVYLRALRSSAYIVHPRTGSCSSLQVEDQPAIVPPNSDLIIPSLHHDLFKSQHPHPHHFGPQTPLPTCLPKPRPSPAGSILFPPLPHLSPTSHPNSSSCTSLPWPRVDPRPQLRRSRTCQRRPHSCSVPFGIGSSILSPPPTSKTPLIRHFRP